MLLCVLLQLKCRYLSAVLLSLGWLPRNAPGVIASLLIPSMFLFSFCLQSASVAGREGCSNARERVRAPVLAIGLLCNVVS